MPGLDPGIHAAGTRLMSPTAQPAAQLPASRIAVLHAGAIGYARLKIHACQVKGHDVMSDKPVLDPLRAIRSHLFGARTDVTELTEPVGWTEGQHRKTKHRLSRSSKNIRTGVLWRLSLVEASKCNSSPTVRHPHALAGARGRRVVFFCGAGISYPAGLPGFKGAGGENLPVKCTALSDIEREASSVSSLTLRSTYWSDACLGNAWPSVVLWCRR